MTDVIIYHNPACGTSRNTLALLVASGETPVVIEYLKNPPSRSRLVGLLKDACAPVAIIGGGGWDQAAASHFAVFAELDVGQALGAVAGGVGAVIVDLLARERGAARRAGPSRASSREHFDGIER